MLEYNNLAIAQDKKKTDRPSNVYFLQYLPGCEGSLLILTITMCKLRTNIVETGDLLNEGSLSFLILTYTTCIRILLSYIKLYKKPSH